MARNPWPVVVLDYLGTWQALLFGFVHNISVLGRSPLDHRDFGDEPMKLDSSGDHPLEY
jgi:hypothetical protein